MQLAPATPQPAPAARWPSQLDIDLQRKDDRTVAHHQHTGGLRVLAAHYPEGPQRCHLTLVHPPGGLVGGDAIDLHLHAAPHTRALITTPGASRYYRSLGSPAVQRTRLHLQAGAQVEWLPLESIAYPGCLGENRLQFTLESGAQLLAWDLLALGLPASGAAFASGRFTQHLEWPQHWLERGGIDANDAALLRAPGGLAGHAAQATLLLAAGSPLPADQRAALLEAARALAAQQQSDVWVGATSPQQHLVLVRGVAARIEPLLQLWQDIRAAWRQTAWQLPACTPRIWHM
ncbi:urease accessory protein UreD [Thiomonas sp.]|uniref:urease accessory protein UreD n=1 Tax=Thiomonas sp. TaxID=2047785 RepID=UPI00260EF4F1|nr:urease accessory protein UreD [Thiomonas sp.]